MADHGVNQTASRGVIRADRLVDAGDREDRAIGAKGQGEQGARALCHRPGNLARGQVPDSHVAVGSGRGELVVARAKGERMDRAFVAGKPAALDSGGGIPQPDRSLALVERGDLAQRLLDDFRRSAAASGDHFSVTTERDAGKTLNVVRENQGFTAYVEIDDPHRTIDGCESQSRAVVIIGQCKRGSQWRAKRALGAAGRKVPKSDSLFGAGGGELAAIGTKCDAADPSHGSSRGGFAAGGGDRGVIAGRGLGLEQAQAGGRGKAPQLDGRILAGRHEHYRIAIEGQVKDGLGVSAQDLDWFPGGCVPDGKRAIEAGGREQLAIGAKGDGVDTALGRVEAGERGSRFGFRDPYDPIGAAGGDGATRRVKGQRPNFGRCP